MKKVKWHIAGIIFLLSVVFTQNGISASSQSILPLKERARIMNDWLKIRLDKVLPEIMRREGFDMWIVICREYNEDPVYLTLLPKPIFSARRMSVLIFYDRGKEEVERLILSRSNYGDYYKGVWDQEKMTQWECLAKVVAERDPKKIGINEADKFAFGDGLSSGLKKKLLESLDQKYISRLHSAEKLAVGWLETRIPEELEVYPQIVSIAHEIIREAFSNNVITPGITTTDDVVWWIREKISELKLETWFPASISIQRRKSSPFGNSNIIHRGDLLHCDVGIIYLGLNTDTQEHAYILKEGETYAPEGLKKALADGNRLQDITIAEFREGLTGNEILKSSLEKAIAEGLNPSIYCHPLGFHGHGAGPVIGLFDSQAGVPGRGDYQLYANTCYAIELNERSEIPEWDNQEIRMMLEQDAVFTGNTVRFLDGRQTELHIIY